MMYGFFLVKRGREGERGEVDEGDDGRDHGVLM